MKADAPGVGPSRHPADLGPPLPQDHRKERRTGIEQNDRIAWIHKRIDRRAKRPARPVRDQNPFVGVERQAIVGVQSFCNGLPQFSKSPGGWIADCGLRIADFRELANTRNAVGQIDRVRGAHLIEVRGVFELFQWRGQDAIAVVMEKRRRSAGALLQLAEPAGQTGTSEQFRHEKRVGHGEILSFNIGAGMSACILTKPPWDVKPDPGERRGVSPTCSDVWTCPAGWTHASTLAELMVQCFEIASQTTLRRDTPCPICRLPSRKRFRHGPRDRRRRRAVRASCRAPSAATDSTGCSAAAVWGASSWLTTCNSTGRWLSRSRFCPAPANRLHEHASCGKPKPPPPCNTRTSVRFSTWVKSTANPI